MQSVHCFDIAFTDLFIDRKEIYRLMGYDGICPNEDVSALTEQYLLELSTCCTPRVAYCILQGEVCNKEQVRVHNTVLNTGALITAAMRNAESYILFTATAGKGFDQWFHRIKGEDDILNTFIAHSIGSVIAEAAVEKLMQHIETEICVCGNRISNRYSPGYCDWHLNEQQKLLSFFSVEETHITLTESCLMLPIKSVSGIVAMGSHVKKLPYGCDICKMKNCIKNKKKQALVLT